MAHILYLIDSLRTGGAETLVINTLNFLSKNYPELRLSIITTSSDTGKLKQYLDERIGYHFIDCTGMHFLSGSKKIKKFIKENGVTHLHTHLYLSSMVGRRVFVPGLKIFETYHNLEYSISSIYYSRWRVLYDRLTYHSRIFSIYVSQEVKQSLLTYRPHDHKNIVLSNFAGEAFSYNYEFKPQKGLKLIAIGTLDAVKNFKFALNVLSNIKGEEIELDIYGEGPLRKELQEAIELQSLPVRLMGRVVLTKEIFGIYDAFLMCSVNEGMPISLLEALAAGMPCLLPDHLPVMKEVAQSAGIYFSIREQESLAKALIEIYNGKLVLKNMSLEARKRSKEFSISTHIQLLMNAYQLEKYKVLFILNDLSGGGAEKVFVNIANGFVLKGMDVDLLLGNNKGVYFDLLDPGINIHILGSTSFMGLIKTLPKFFRGRNYSHVFTASDYISAATVITKRKIKANFFTVATLHYNLYYQLSILPVANRLWVAWLNRNIISTADKIVAVSNGVLEDFKKVAGKRLPDARTIYNPVIEDKIYDLAAMPIEDHFMNVPFIVNIGRLCVQKNQLNLLKAFRLVHQKYPLVNLLILGVGELLDELKAYTIESGLEDAVYFMGFQKNPFKYLAKAKLSVLSSDYEGLGNVIIESLALGVNVVSTDCLSGPSEILQGNKYGWLAKVNDSADLAEKMELALNNPKPSALLKLRAQDFRNEIIVEEYLSVLV